MSSKPAPEPLGKDMRALLTKNSAVENNQYLWYRNRARLPLRMFQFVDCVVVDRERAPTTFKSGKAPGLRF